ncbi:MAG: hypothetical protein JNM67_11505 [Bacteroidetes bacterium]|nr:hypothetical protein [Bacteroidota bacterium]
MKQAVMFKSPYNCTMNLNKLLLVAFISATSFLKAQNYQVTHIYMVKNGTPRPINAKIEIKDSMYTMYTYGADTTKTQYKVTKIVGSEYFLSNGSVLIFSESTDRSERKAGVYYMEFATDYKNPNRKSLHFRTVKVQ